MRYRVEILPSAWEDLKRIEDYYSIEFGIESALKVSNAILDSLERLERFPESGSRTPDEWLNNQGYRMVVCGKFISIYKEIRNSIFVYHIANTQTEYTRLFLDN